MRLAGRRKRDSCRVVRECMPRRLRIGRSGQGPHATEGLPVPICDSARTPGSNQPVESERKNRSPECCRGSAPVPQNCVFFAQHLIKKRQQGLWEWALFIAAKGLSAMVEKRQRGASPGRTIRLAGCTEWPAQVWQRVWVDRLVTRGPVSGEQGEVPSVPVALGGYRTLSRETMFGGSR